MGIQLNTHEYMWARPCLHACKATNKAATAACNPIEHLACMKLNEIRASISDKNLPLFRHKHKENAGSLRHAGHHEIRPWVAAAATGSRSLGPPRPGRGTACEPSLFIASGHVGASPAGRSLSDGRAYEA